MQITVDYRERRSGLIELLEEHCNIKTAGHLRGFYIDGAEEMFYVLLIDELFVRQWRQAWK